MNVGQTLYWSPSRGHGQKGEVSITKVGRRWIELDNGYRIDKQTMRADGKGYSSPGCCFLSEADYETTLKLNLAWREFRLLVERTFSVPDGVTFSQIENARRALFKGSQVTREASRE